MATGRSSFTHYRPLTSRLGFVYLLRRGEALPADCVVDDIRSPVTARFAVDDLEREEFNRSTLREIARAETGHTDDSDLALEALCRLLERGDLRLARPLRRRIPAVPLPEARTTGSSPPARVTTRGMFSVLVIDDFTEDPLPNVKLHVKLPGGTEQDATTDSSGRIDLSVSTRGFAEISVAPDGQATMADAYMYAGAGALASGPRTATTSSFARQAQAGGATLSLLRIEAHRVQTGETLADLATVCGISTQDLAKFNWGVTEQSDIDRHLRTHVGCTKMRPDGRTHVLDSSDSPGIVYLPRILLMPGLGLDTLHILRARKATRRFLFSA